MRFFIKEISLQNVKNEKTKLEFQRFIFDIYLILSVTNDRYKTQGCSGTPLVCLISSRQFDTVHKIHLIVNQPSRLIKYILKKFSVL